SCVWSSGSFASERAHLRRNGVDRQRCQLHRLVVEPVAFAEPERVLHPLGVVATVRKFGIVDRALVFEDVVRAAAEIIVARAHSMRLSTSSASMRAVLKTFDLSARCMVFVRSAIALTLAT